jgi:hypothetical protein
MGEPMSHLSLPEYRQIELYSKKRVLTFAEDNAAELAEATATVVSLAQVFTELDFTLGEPLESPDSMAVWRKYRALPRRTAIDKLTAELYRTLRIFHAATWHETGLVTVKNGLIKAAATIERTALSIRISRVGMTLLESAVAYRLGTEGQPYPDAYVEAMLCRYWADIAAEIHWYYDEDQVLYQFQDRLGLNRHLRFDCDNPKFSTEGGLCRFVIGESFRDAARYPIDFFVVIDTHLHIIPVEALTDGAIPLADLPRWRARLADGITLPASFRPRFGREVMVPGLPMT